MMFVLCAKLVSFAQIIIIYVSVLLDVLLIRINLFAGLKPSIDLVAIFVREGDVVVVESISRIARNTKDLLEIVEQLEEKGVDFISKKEAIDTKTPSGKFMLTVFGAIAQLEREYILDRQREGIEIARQNGKYKGRKPIAMDMDKFALVYSEWKSGKCKAVEAMNELGLKPATFYRRVKEYENSTKTSIKKQ